MTERMVIPEYERERELKCRSPRARTPQVIGETFDEKINKVFNQIRNLSDRNQIHNALTKLDNKDQKMFLIDRILKRKDEIVEAQEIMKMPKVQTLLSRFIRKLKKPHLTIVVSEQNSDEA